MKDFKINILTILLLLSISVHFYAQSDSTYQRPKVGLALSGGSAHGLAHIGVLRFLEEIDFPVDYITGTSMGSIVGGLSAMGYSSDHIYEIQKSMNWDEIIENRIMLDKISPAEKFHHNKYFIEADITKKGLRFPYGLVQSNNLDLVLSRLYLPSYRIDEFSELPTPFKCYSVDLVSGKAVSLDRGNLSLAIRSSMAIPPLFPPVFQDDKVLVDGGLIINFPVEEVRDMGADIVVGSYVGAIFEKKNEITSLLDIIKQSSLMMGIKESHRQSQGTDILLEPDIKMYSSFDFKKADLYIAEGYKAALQQKDKFLKLQDSLSLYASEKDWKAPLAIEDSIFIDKIIIPEVSIEMRALVVDKTELKDGEKYALADIEAGISRAYATKNFKSLRYQIISNDNDENTLIINALPIKNLSVGLTLNRFESSGPAAIIGLTARNIFSDLLDARIYARLSEHPALYSELTRRGGIGSRNFVYGIKTKIENLTQPLYTDDYLKLEFESLELDLDAGLTWEYNTALAFSLYFNLNNHFLRNEFRRPPGVFRYSHDLSQFKGKISYSTLDQQELPSRGIEASIISQFVNSMKISKTLFDSDERIIEYLDRGFIGSVQLRQAIPITDKINFNYRAAAQFMTYETPTLARHFGSNYQNHDNRLPFIGLLESRLQFNNFIYGRVAIKYALNKRFSLAAISNYAVGNKPVLLEATADAQAESVIGFGLGIHAMFPWGPLQLEIGRTADDSDVNTSFTFGYRMFR